MINLLEVRHGNYENYGIEILKFEYNDIDKCLIGVNYDKFGNRLFIGFLYFEFRINF